MNMEKIKTILTRTALFLAISIFTLTSVPAYYVSAYASQNGAVVFDGSQYNEEAEYLQYCLNKLGYRDYDNNMLDTDGYFGDKTKSALAGFLKAEGLGNFNNAAKDKLISLAESSETRRYESGFSKDAGKLIPTAFAYSSLSNINSSDDPFYSMSVLKELPFIITMKPTELSYKSMRVAEAIKKQTKLFGYVNLGPDNPEDGRNNWRMADLSNVESEIDSIAEAGWYGVFVDQMGYDFNETRDRQNTIIDYIHKKGLVCMSNSWLIEDTLDSSVDPIYNPHGEPSHLNSDDWCLVESFLLDGDSYRGDTSYMEKYLKIKENKESTGINIAVLSYKMDSKSWQQSAEDIKMSYILAQCLGFDGWWFGKTENSDHLLYGKEPGVNIGTTFVKPLSLESGNLYTAETEEYRIEYYAQDTPVLKLIPKK